MLIQARLCVMLSVCQAISYLLLMALLFVTMFPDTRADIDNGYSVRVHAMQVTLAGSVAFVLPSVLMVFALRIGEMIRDLSCEGKDLPPTPLHVSTTEKQRLLSQQSRARGAGFS